MRSTIIGIFLLAFVCVVGNAYSQDSITTLILVRHAEKDQDGSSDPGLSVSGKERAKLLADMLIKSGITSIYSTNYQRTRSTVEPLANQLGQSVKLYKPFDEASVKQILSENLGGTVLIVGHSNNIPWIANLFTGTKDFPDWKDDEYSNLLVMTILGNDGKAKVTNLTFGN